MPVDVTPTLNLSVSSSGNFTPGFILPTILSLFGFFAILGLLAFVAWIWSIVDIAKNPNFKDSNIRVIWLILVVLLGPIVSVIYFFARPKSQVGLENISKQENQVKQ